MRYALFIIGLIVFSQTNAQYHLANHYTTTEGLPSNGVYMIFEDEKGFLWITTDQGIARFDGMRFQKYTVADGLPDNDALVTLIDQEGTIWVKGNNGHVAYSNKETRKFINEYNDIRLASLSKNAFLRPFLIKKHGICFADQDTSFICYRNEIKAIPTLAVGRIKSAVIDILNDGSLLRFGFDTSNAKVWCIYHTNGQEIISVKELASKSAFGVPYIHEGKIYFMNQKEDKKVLIANIHTSPLSFKFDTLNVSKSFFWHNFTEKHLCLHAESGLMQFYNKVTLKPEFILDCQKVSLNFYEDKKKNYWIATAHSGVQLYQQRKIFELPLPPSYTNQPFASITKNEKEGLLIGNTAGEITKIKNNKINSFKRKNAKNTDIQRSIILNKYGTYTFGEDGMYFNHTNKIEHNINECKAAYQFNDSVILCGFLKGMCALHIPKNTIEELFNGSLEVTSFSSANNDGFYFGSSDGLYYFDYKNRATKNIPLSSNHLHDRIVALNTSKDGLLWVATASNGVFVLYRDNLLHHVTTEDGLKTNNSLSLTQGNNQQVWIGTNEGISMLNYSFKDKLLIKRIQNLTVHDGLTSNTISQMAFLNDTIYAASDQGIAVIPASIDIPHFNIPIELTGIKINNRDTVLKTYYKLKNSQKNINIQFAGVELTGHFKNAQFSQDHGQVWTNSDVNSISFQFSAGVNTLWLRSVDVNGHIGTKILKLTFEVEKPLYQRWWFITLLGLGILTLTTGIYNYQTKLKHKKVVEQLLQKQLLDEYEIQSLKAQINPHFIFNCLNSIKGFIYEEDLDKAELYLQKFADLLRNTLNYSSQPSILLLEELQYIDTYLMLEKLRFPDKFEYHISCPSNINQSEIRIPAMLLQPFVENAIKHGICNRKGPFGKILISLQLASNELKIIIDDNGVGRKTSAEIKKKRNKDYESKGSVLTQRRLELYKISCEIIDKLDIEQKSVGTKIILILPLPLYKQTIPNE